MSQIFYLKIEIIMLSQKCFCMLQTQPWYTYVPLSLKAGPQMGSRKKILRLRNRLVFCAYEIGFFTIIFIVLRHITKEKFYSTLRISRDAQIEKV